MEKARMKSRKSHTKKRLGLRETGETEMADDLNVYTHRTSKKGGWDGAVTGEKENLINDTANVCVKSYGRIVIDKSP
ncbi:hypothetical protein C2I18_08895 [Paenibacillus sp. PK3_47]|nr:hypothetical protein C2I18_08895 [Paenibacillus sp. PK3_47]